MLHGVRQYQPELVRSIEGFGARPSARLPCHAHRGACFDSPTLAEDDALPLEPARGRTSFCVCAEIATDFPPCTQTSVHRTVAIVE